MLKDAGKDLFLKKVPPQDMVSTLLFDLPDPKDIPERVEQIQRDCPETMKPLCSHNEFKPRLTTLLQTAKPYAGTPCSTYHEKKYNEKACLAYESFHNKVFQDLEDKLLKPLLKSNKNLKGIGAACLARKGRENRMKCIDKYEFVPPPPPVPKCPWLPIEPDTDGWCSDTQFLADINKCQDNLCKVNKVLGYDIKKHCKELSIGTKACEAIQSKIPKLNTCIQELQDSENSEEEVEKCLAQNPFLKDVIKIYVKEFLKKTNDDMCKEEDFKSICSLPNYKSKLEDAQLSAIVTCNDLLEEDSEDVEPFMDCVVTKSHRVWEDIVADNFFCHQNMDEALCEGMEQEHCKAIMALRDDCTSNKSKCMGRCHLIGLTSSHLPEDENIVQCLNTCDALDKKDPTTVAEMICSTRDGYSSDCQKDYTCLVKKCKHALYTSKQDTCFMSHCVRKEDMMKELCINMHDGDEENVCDDILSMSVEDACVNNMNTCFTALTNHSLKCSVSVLLETSEETDDAACINERQNLFKTRVNPVRVCTGESLNEVCITRLELSDACSKTDFEVNATLSKACKQELDKLFP